MRGDRTTEDEGKMDDNGEDAAGSKAASGERRPSVAMLQNLLKKVSHSPFQNQYQTLVSSTSESSGNECLLSQDVVNGGLAQSNPFYKYYLESGVNGRLQEDATRKSPEQPNLDSACAPPPGLQSPALDTQTDINMGKNGAEVSKPKIPMKRNRVQGLPQTQSTSTNGKFHDVTMTPPDLFKPISAPTQIPSNALQSKGSDVFKDSLQAAQEKDVAVAKGNLESNFPDQSQVDFNDPFKSPSLRGNPSTQATGAPLFSTSTTQQDDLFPPIPTKRKELLSKMPHCNRNSREIGELFAPPSQFAVDPFPSPVTNDLFQDTSGFEDPFGNTPSKPNNPFRDASPDSSGIFQPLPPNADGKNVFSEAKSNAISSPDLSPGPIPPKSDQPQDVLLTSPQHDVVQRSAFSRTRNLSMTARQSAAKLTHVQTLKRPPKPLPRTQPQRTQKPPRPETPPKPDKPPRPEKPPTLENLVKPEAPVPKTSPKPPLRGLPKPVVQHKPKTLESKQPILDNSMVFEDILLIGQEKCVEDWPEDSPELDPDFKPSGTLRLRRESYKLKGESDGGSSEDQDGSGSQTKKKDRKLRMSLLSRRASKEKFPDDSKEEKSRTLSISRKSSKDHFSENNMSAGEMEEEEQNGLDYRKKQKKSKVNDLLRRASTKSFTPDAKHMNGHLPQESKEEGKKSASKKKSITRRGSEGTVLDGSTGGEEEDGGEDQHGEKNKKKMKIKFVPQRGFAITVEKGEELKGAQGYTPRKGSKDKSQDEVLGACGYTPRKTSKDDVVDDVEEMKSKSLHSASKAELMEEEELQRALHVSAGLSEDFDPYAVEDVKPKKSTKMKLKHAGQRSSKEEKLENSYSQKKKGSLSAEELDDEDLHGMDKKKKSNHKGPVPVPRKSKAASGQSEATGFSSFGQQKACNEACGEDDDSDFMSPEDAFASDADELDSCTPKKSSKLKGFKKQRKQSKAKSEYEDPPGAASADFLSEAAKAEWLAAQKDGQVLGLEDLEEEGDTDSLMEWWNTVEQWDEVPSDEEDVVLKEDESKSFTILADKVQRGMRVYNKVFTERAEILWQSIIRLHAIADDISSFHHKAKIAGITGGTTTAVGGVAAIAGLALSPFTLGASLVITAVGVGVATAGGIASASAAISDNVNNMHDRKKVEIVLEEYEGHLLVIGKILHFINQGLYKLRGHPFLRSGTQHYSKDWEIRRAVQMIGLADSPVMRATEITDTAILEVQGLFEGMDKYFLKDSRELKKGCKKEVVAQIKGVATVLNDAVVELNAIREELQEATGSV